MRFEPFEVLNSLPVVGFCMAKHTAAGSFVGTACGDSSEDRESSAELSVAVIAVRFACEGSFGAEIGVDFVG